MAHEPGRSATSPSSGIAASGKTSLVEALLFQTGMVNRLGTIEAGRPVTDWDDDEHKRQMSLSSSLAHLEWQEPEDQPHRRAGRPGLPGRRDRGAPGGRGRALRAQRRDGRRGRHEPRLWAREADLGLARVLFVNMLDRERADFFRTLGVDPRAALRQVRRRAPPDRLRARADRDRRRAAHVRVHEPRGRQGGRAGRDPGRDGRPGGRVPREAARRGRRDRRGADGALPRRAGARRRRGRERAEDRGHARRGLPVACGVATKNLGTHALLDLLVEGVPSPAKKGAPIEVDGAGTAAFVFKTIADPFAGRINVFRVLTGTVKGDSTSRTCARTRRSGSARCW